MSADDVADQLFAAFIDADPVPGPQLLVDAHAEIIRLRAQVADLQDRTDDHRRRVMFLAAQLDQASVVREHDISERIAGHLANRERAHQADLAALQLAHRAELDDLAAHHRATLRTATARYLAAETYRDAVAPLPDVIARRRLMAGGTSADSDLLVAVTRAITKANRRHANQRARTVATQTRPEGIPA